MNEGHQEESFNSSVFAGIEEVKEEGQSSDYTEQVEQYLAYSPHFFSQVLDVLLMHDIIVQFQAIWSDIVLFARLTSPTSNAEKPSLFFLLVLFFNRLAELDMPAFIGFLLRCTKDAFQSRG